MIAAYLQLEDLLKTPCSSDRPADSDNSPGTLEKHADSDCAEAACGKAPPYVEEEALPHNVALGTGPSPGCTRHASCTVDCVSTSRIDTMRMAVHCFGVMYTYNWQHMVVLWLSLELC